MAFETKNYAVKYTEAEFAKNRRDIVKRGIMATSHMDFEKEKVEKMGIRNQSDLPVHLNYSSYQYRYIRGSKY